MVEGNVRGDVLLPYPIFPESFGKVSWTVFDKKIEGSFAALYIIY